MREQKHRRFVTNQRIEKFSPTTARLYDFLRRKTLPDQMGVEGLERIKLSRLGHFERTRSNLRRVGTQFVPTLSRLISTRVGKR
jgi:hypothetical protein